MRKAWTQCTSNTSVWIFAHNVIFFKGSNRICHYGIGSLILEERKVKALRSFYILMQDGDVFLTPHVGILWLR